MDTNTKGHAAMSRAEFAKKLAAHPNMQMTPGEALVCINSFFETLQDSLAEFGSVQFSGHGTYRVSERAAREGKNMRTGDPMKIKACRVVTFKSGRGMKDRINDIPKKKKVH